MKSTAFLRIGLTISWSTESRVLVKNMKSKLEGKPKKKNVQGSECRAEDHYGWRAWHHSNAGQVGINQLPCINVSDLVPCRNRMEKSARLIARANRLHIICNQIHIRLQIIGSREWLSLSLILQPNSAPRDREGSSQLSASRVSGINGGFPLALIHS